MAVYTTIDKPSDYFNTVLYSGTGSENAITGIGFSPNLVWIKGRDGSSDHRLVDTVRGATKELYSSAATAETTDAQGLKSFDSDGFTLGTTSATNSGTKIFVSWNWLAGTTASGTTGGSGTGKSYSYSANATSGFSIVTYTGNATAGHLIPHGMTKVPRLIHVKSRGDDNTWHSGTIGSASAWNDHGYLSLANAFGTDANQFGATPDSTNFRLGTGTGTNGNNGTRVAYCFADVQGYQKIGVYTGSGDNDGPVVHCGFKPAFILRKNLSSATSWSIMDNKRFGRNVVLPYIHPNATTVEQTDQNVNNIDILSTGFKCRESDDDGNASGSKYLFHAIAENPFVTSGGVPATAF